MKKKYIVAIIAVVILIAAAIGIYLLINKDGKNKETTYNDPDKLVAAWIEAYNNKDAKGICNTYHEKMAKKVFDSIEECNAIYRDKFRSEKYEVKFSLIGSIAVEDSDGADVWVKLDEYGIKQKGVVLRYEVEKSLTSEEGDLLSETKYYLTIASTTDGWVVVGNSYNYSDYVRLTIN